MVRPRPPSRPRPASPPRPAGPTPPLSVALVALAAVSCSGGEVGPEEALHVNELPRLAWTEELRLGSVDDPVEGFSRIGGLELTDDGTLYVLEFQAREVRVFGPEGRHVRTVGRPGEGPGEFTRPRSLGLLGDTLWVRDGRAGRVSWFAPDGSLLHETPGATLPVETDVPGMSLRVVTGEPRADGFVGSTYTRLMGGGAADRPFSVPVVRFDRDGTVVDTLRWDTIRPGPTVRVGGRPLHPPSLLPRSPVVVTVGDGRLEIDWAVPGSWGVLDILRIGTAGDTLSRRALRYEPVALPASVRDSLLELREGMGRFYDVSDAELKAALASGLELPDHRPPIRSARAGRDGGVWIELNGESPDSAEWLVIGEGLAPRGRVSLPVDMTPRLMDGSMVWAVETDALEVPWLVRLRLEPT